MIESFRFEVVPWLYSKGDPRHDEWRVTVAVDGMSTSCTQVFPKVPWNQSALEVYLRAAGEAFRKAGVHECPS